MVLKTSKAIIKSIVFDKNSLKLLSEIKIKIYILIFVLIQVLSFIIRYFFSEFNWPDFIKIYFSNIFTLFIINLFLYEYLKNKNKSVFKYLIQDTLIITYFSIFTLPFINITKIYGIVNSLLGLYSLFYFYKFLSINLECDKRNCGKLFSIIIISNIVTKLFVFFMFLLINSI